MDRRKFLALGAAASLFPAAANAEWGCSPFDYSGVQVCQVGVPGLRFYQSLQECQNWCWAACIQMIFATSGRLVNQHSIVQRLFGDVRCSTAVGPQIAAVINSGTWRDVNGYRFQAEAVALTDLYFGVANPYAADIAAAELSAGHPLINGAVGHATVLSGMTILRDVYGRTELRELIVRDPWPFNQQRRTLTAEEVVGTNFLMAVRVY